MRLAEQIRDDATSYGFSGVGIARLLWAVATNPGLTAVALFRLQTRLRGALAPLAKVVRALNSAITGADFVPGCIVGRRLHLQHPSGVVVGKGAIVGDDVTLLQQVTLGEKLALDGEAQYPSIGSGAVVGAGAKVLGKVCIGERATIGANAVVLADVPPDAVAVGVPARVVNAAGEATATES